MKKNYFKLMMLALMLAIAIPTADAHDFEVDGIYYLKNGDEAIVTYQGDYYSSYIEYQGSVTIPTTVTYEGTTYSVTAIGDWAFANCKGLTSVSIPNSVTSIGDRTFRCCSGLTSVTIGESVTTIGEDAFDDCSSLTTLNYNAVCYADSTLSSYDYPFYGTSISTIIIGENVQKVPCFFVHGLSSLANLSVESGNTTYDSRDNCNAIIETASNTLVLGSMNTVIPNSVTTIGDDAFSGCSGLTSVTIPESVTSIGNSAFEDCSSLTTLNYNAESCASFSSSNPPFYGTSISTINIGESVQKIPAYFAYRLWGLTSVTIPESVTTIGDFAFSRCTGLTSVTIPNSVTSIGSSAFMNCSSLTTLNFNAVSCADFSSSNNYHPFFRTGISTIIIGESVQRVPLYFVNRLDSLTSLSVESGNTTYDSRDNCNAIIATASNTLVAGCKNTFIPESVTAIGDYAFYGCRGLTSVTIPESVSAIGIQAFKYCRLLTSLNYNAVCCADFSSIKSNNPFDETGISSIIIGENVQKVPAYFLNGLSTLVSLSVESGNTTYDSRDNCNAIIATSSNTLVTGCKNTVIPESVTAIGDCAFCNCTGLTSVDIPNTVTTIGKEAFYWCTNLASVTIGNSVTTIDDVAFYWCTGLTSVIIPNSVTYIGNRAFDGCSGLTSVTIPESVTYIGYAAFLDCTGLTSVTIPKSVKTLGHNAFSDCTALTSVTISSSTTTIGYFAFNGCPALMSVTCLTAIPPKAYSSFYSNATLYVPKGAVQIYQTTSYWEEFPTIVGIDVDIDMPGDVNNDGVLDITDVTDIITLLLVNSGESFPLGDVNGDGQFTIADVTALINHLLGGGK